ncbi:MAG TPA: hydroxymethylbilane synthase [Candidatus Baltobacteraceae bacterium]|nr:hydroxymethylbilane synthase [Candidatus Baltobacteraceae bacterium]
MQRKRLGAAPYPIALDLRERRVVIVGAGAIAARKLPALLEAGASVTLVAPAAEGAVREAAAAGRVAWIERNFGPDDLDGATLVFAATGDDAVNAAVVAAARERGALVDDASDAGRGDFATPLVHRTGGVTFSIDTGGRSPSFALRLREELRERFDERYGRAAEALGRIRGYVVTVVPAELRAEVMGELAARPIEQLATLDEGRAQNEVDAAVARLSGVQRSEGELVAAIAATRNSALALWQTRHVMAKLAGAGIVSTILTVSTKGDRVQDRPLTALGGDGVFVKELEAALRARDADYAVHSCKDLPSTLPDDMRLAAIGEREDARDAFCSQLYPSFEDLPRGAVVGTSSPRRAAQLRALRSDLRYEPIRGNVDTRLRKLRDGQYDAVVLAMAGLKRLGLSATHTEPIDPALVTPAPGQGALAIECRAADKELAGRIHAAFADAPTERAVSAERAFLRKFGAGCQAPLGAFARFEGERLDLSGVVAAGDGSSVLRRTRSAPARSLEEAEACGTALAYEMIAAGANGILALNVVQSGPLRGRTFLLPRTQSRPSRIAPALRGAGAEVVEASSSDDAELALGGRAPDVLLFPSSGSVRAVTEYLARLRENRERPVVATMGAASSAAARAAGFPPDVVAVEENVAAFVQSVTHHVMGRNGS